MAWFNNPRFPYFTMQQLNLDWLMDKIRGFLPKNDDTAAAGQIIVRQADGSSLWTDPATVSLDIDSLPGESTMASADEFIFYDDSSSSNKKITFDDLETQVLGDIVFPGTVDINGLTAESTVAPTVDMLVMYDNSANENRKVTVQNAFKANLGSSTPAMDGTGSAGSANTAARSDHVHPTDTSRQAALSTAQVDACNSGITAAKVSAYDVLVASQQYHVGDVINLGTGYVYCAGYCNGATVARIGLILQKTVGDDVTGVSFSGSCAFVVGASNFNVSNPSISQIYLSRGQIIIDIAITGGTSYNPVTAAIGNGAFTFT